MLESILPLCTGTPCMSCSRSCSLPGHLRAFCACGVNTVGRLSSDHNVINDDSLDDKVVDGSRHSKNAGCVTITQIVHQLELELLQSEEALIGRERTVCHHPEHVRIDDVDVEKGHPRERRCPYRCHVDLRMVK